MMGPLRVAVVDDEPPAVRRLKLALAELPDVVVAGSAADGPAALELLARGGLDVVLLDIEMPGLSGLDVLRAAPRDNPPAFVFVTAFSRYATDAFDLAAVDYLLKPVEFDRLRRALDRARETLMARTAAARLTALEAAMQALPPSLPDGGWLTDLWVPDRGERIRLAIDQIDWIEAERDYVRLHGRGRSFLLRKTIRELETALDPTVFVRVHRGALVRRDRVARIARRAGGLFSLVLQSGAEVPVARRLAARVRRLAADS